MSEIIACPSGLSGRIRGIKVREERILDAFLAIRVSASFSLRKNRQTRAE